MCGRSLLSALDSTLRAELRYRNWFARFLAFPEYELLVQPLRYQIILHRVRPLFRQSFVTALRLESIGMTAHDDRADLHGALLEQRNKTIDLGFAALFEDGASRVECRVALYVSSLLKDRELRLRWLCGGCVGSPGGRSAVSLPAASRRGRSHR